MSSNRGSHTERSRTAEQALATIPHGGRDAIELRVHCSRSHTLSTVYDTDSGLVYASPLRGRSHGSHDLPDSPHSGHEAKRWLDLLDVDPILADDALPAWCDCGQRTLSRAEVQKWIAGGDHRVVLD